MVLDLMQITICDIQLLKNDDQILVILIRNIVKVKLWSGEIAKMVCSKESYRVRLEPL